MPIEATEAKAWIAENRDGLTKSLIECTDDDVLFLLGIMPDKMTQLWDVGCWLKVKLMAIGCPERQAADICFAQGQQSVFRDPLEVALQYANEYERTAAVQDKPGLELADRINGEYLGAVK